MLAPRHPIINRVFLGEGDDVVTMVHGLATSLAFWLPTAQPLSRRHRVLLYDLRGHGRSEMPSRGYSPSELCDDLVRLLDEEGIERTLLVAHSFGGSVALRFACLHPERVSGLVFADARLRVLQPTQAPATWPRWPQMRAQMLRLGLELDADDGEGGIQLLRELAKLHARDQHRDPAPKWIAQFFGGGSRFTAKRWLELLASTEAARELRACEALSRDRVEALRCPSLAIYSGSSPVLPTMRALAPLWPHMRCEIVADAGHFFPLGRGAFVAQHIDGLAADIARHSAA